MLSSFVTKTSWNVDNGFVFMVNWLLCTISNSIALYQLNRSQEGYPRHIAVVTNHNSLSKILLNSYLSMFLIKKLSFSTPIWTAIYLFLWFSLYYIQIYNYRKIQLKCWIKPKKSYHYNSNLSLKEKFIQPKILRNFTFCISHVKSQNIN